jgi:nondiscriminating glutamyl-tRNA synthetase
LSAPRVRFAPSPTGELHVGNARTALFNWLYARARGGALILRIEDTDAARSLPEHEAGLVSDLRWLGLGWDEGIEEGGAHGPYRQSERLPLYRERAAELVARGLSYPCFCSAALLEEERAAQREAGRVSLYSGRCRRIPPAEARVRQAREAAALRFDVTTASAGDDAVVFVDRVHDAIRFPIAQIGDFVILRRDGWPSYNFAVVVDDLLMAITHVIRGDDHLSNTPRQILIYRALGAAVLPEFAHLPLITGPGGAPLSKREAAVSLGWFRQRGYPPEALVNALALLGWSPPGGQELLTMEELIARFDLDHLSRAPAVFDRAKLDALASRHMARLPPPRLAALAVEHLLRRGLLPAEPPPGSWEWAGRLAQLYADRLPRMSDLPEASAFLFDFSAERSLLDPEVREALVDPKARAVIEGLARRLDSEPLTAPRFQVIADEVRRQTGAKGRDLYHPMRVALTGASSGPELVRLLPVIEEGSRLALPRRIASCAERVRALLAADPAPRP